MDRGPQFQFFRDRAEAGRLLAARLAHLKPRAPVILAPPRGGVPVGCEIATALEAPLDIVLVRKLRPFSRSSRLARWLRESRLRSSSVERYMPTPAPVAIAGRIVVLVDDGVATGATSRLCSPRRLPVGVEDEIEALRRQRLSGPAIAGRLGRPVSTVGVALRRRGLGRLAALDPRPPVIRHQRERPGELIHGCGEGDANR